MGYWLDAVCGLLPLLTGPWYHVLGLVGVEVQEGLGQLCLVRRMPASLGALAR